MKNLAAIAILVSVAAIGISLVGCLTQQGLLTLSEGIEIITLGGLILVTSWYSYSTYGIQRATADQVATTREQAEISREATEIALNATKNSVLPIVRVGAAGRRGTQIAPGNLHVEEASINYKNIGKGPALNLEVWLRYNDLEGLGDCAGSTKKRTNVLAAGEEGRCEWRLAEESLPLPGQSDLYDVVAEYTDIYRRRFRSTLFLNPANQIDFSFRQVPELEEQDRTQ